MVSDCRHAACGTKLLHGQRDPFFLPPSNNILDQRYHRGYSAAVDTGKSFYQFTTHPDDRPFLGLLHPVTGILYAYGGLPSMGTTGSSPCLSAAGLVYGLSLLRMLREQCKIFQGIPRANCH
jgi:hypothetical protein